MSIYPLKSAKLELRSQVSVSGNRVVFDCSTRTGRIGKADLLMNPNGLALEGTFEDPVNLVRVPFAVYKEEP